MMNLLHNVSQKPWYPLAKQIAIGVTLSVAALLVLSKLMGWWPFKPAANQQLTQQQARAMAHNRNLNIRRFPDIKNSNRSVCKAYGSAGAKRATYFECYRYQPHNKTWLLESKYGYLPDLIK